MENNSNHHTTSNEETGYNLKAMSQQRSRSVLPFEMVLRFLVFLLTLIASTLIATDQQSKLVPIQVFQDLPPLPLPLAAKWQYLSSLVYLLTANLIASAYTAGALLYSKAAGSKRGKGILVLIILDIIIIGLLFSANGAATAVGWIGRYGNTHTNWHKVCNVFSAYCNHMIAALAVSYSGTVLLLCVVVLAVYNLYEKSIIT